MNPYSSEEIKLLSECTTCPRKCNVDRFSTKLGICKSDSNFGISSICIHKGEEPVISGEKGICNVFFSGCNLQCIFCQNHEISGSSELSTERILPFSMIIERICATLEQTENIVGFVSPSHQVPQMMAIIRGLHKAGKYPVIVYNTNSYDRVETLRLLEGMVDVYLPDFKYSDPDLGVEYSRAENYPEIARAAIREMIRQKGSSLILNDRKVAESGVIIRHLVLPGAIEQSIKVLECIAWDISPDIHVSLMSQYFPTIKVAAHRQLNRTVTPAEFHLVVDAYNHLGFYRGWIQDMDSHAVFRPDFRKEEPF